MVVSTQRAESGSVNGDDGARRSHREVAAELRTRIRSGQLRPGQRMPTQSQLADEFGVERGAVRQALRALKQENLLANMSKGSPATVAENITPVLGGPEAVPQPTMVALGPRITAACQEQHVEIDAICLTAISLTLALGEPLREIHAERMKPARIDVRVLLPSRNINLAFPVQVRTRGNGAAAGDADDPVYRRWLSQRNAQGQVLRHNLLALRASHGIDVRIEFRALPFTPPVKLYLLNSAEALFAYYTLAKVGEEIDHRQLEMYDAQGTQSMLFAFEQGASLRDTTFVEQSHLWFNALWNTISQDLLFAGPG
ncbi:winged helix-turn-helix domain-containing protein [Streptomyces monticola]|uniref:Winged helix-turn-helix domain-containing protein n=1 Tax=Streptomyces monticola TaxID=2666263 RepID=A0ABW2JUS1_9ACTN